jgi:hypothetical protein
VHCFLGGEGSILRGLAACNAIALKDYSERLAKKPGESIALRAQLQHAIERPRRIAARSTLMLADVMGQ